MRTNHKKEKYKEYLKKLMLAKAPEPVNNPQNSDIILHQLRDKSDVFENRILLILLYIILLIFTITTHLRFGNLLRYLPIIALSIVFLVFRHFLMTQSKRARILKTQHRDKAQEMPYNYSKLKLEYLNYGIQIKRLRKKQLLFSYLFFFPVFLIFMTEFIKGSCPFGNFLNAYVVAFLSAGIGWLFIFLPEIMNLDLIQDHLEDEIEMIE